MLCAVRSENTPRTIGMVFLVALIMALMGCGSAQEEAGDNPPDANEPRGETPVTQPENSGAPEAPAERGGRANVVVRLSGTPGTVFAGSYGNLEESTYEEGVLEEPLEFEVDVRDDGFDVVSASFVKPRPDEGSIKAEILVDDEVVTEGTTDIQYGALNVTWSFGG